MKNRGELKAGYRRSEAEGSHAVNIQDGTLSRVASPKPGPVNVPSALKPQRKVKVLAFDGAKVHDFLYHLALSEVRWQDLEAGPQDQPSSLVQAHRARNRTSTLYDLFLAACSKGAHQAVVIDLTNRTARFVVSERLPKTVTAPPTARSAFRRGNPFAAGELAPGDPNQIARSQVCRREW